MRSAVVLILLIPLISLGCKTKPSEPKGGIEDYEPSAEWACYQAKKGVRDRLKAPKSAEFEPCDPADVEFLGSWKIDMVDSTEVIKDVKQYRVPITVHAENSFGAKLKSDYTVVVKHSAITSNVMFDVRERY